MKGPYALTNASVRTRHTSCTPATAPRALAGRDRPPQTACQAPTQQGRLQIQVKARGGATGCLHLSLSLIHI